ncbi:MAG: lipoyl(octanoyl) transferase LipB [Candidatus Coatesbacteria bacterium]
MSRRRQDAAESDAARALSVEWRGLVPYGDGLDLQHEFVQKRKDGAAGDTLLLMEHPLVITFGRRYDAGHLRRPREEILARGASIHRVERGGQATVHNPGQLVGYLVADLWHQGRDIHRFVFNLEETLIRFLKTRGVDARRDPVNRGVWVGDAKIGSVGISVKRNITMHGFSVNLSNDLEPFSWIVPCGIPDGRAASLASVTGKSEDPAAVAFEVADHLARVFGYAVLPD